MKLRPIAFALCLCLLATSAQAAILRVMTYNIHLGALGTDGQRDLGRIADVINAANPDIVALQEVDKNVPRSGNVNQMNQLASLTGMQSYFGKARNLDGGEYGNGILVRQGIDVVSTINRALPNPDNVEARAVIEMNLSVDDNASTTEFTFFATHLAHNSSAGRIESAQYINGLVSGTSMPALLAGDMNFNPGSPAFNTLDSQWTDLTNINNSGKNRANQIDYVFYRGSEWDEVTKSQFILTPLTNVASDHDPLLGVIELPDAFPGAALVWNVGGGVETAFTEGFATGNGNGQYGYFPASPWDAQFNTGEQNLLIGYNGNATFTGSTSRTIGSMRIGTNAAATYIAGHNGDGVATMSSSVGLTVADGAGSTGNLAIGEGGYEGTLNWNSSGTLQVQGKLSIGEGGDATLNQSNGIVIAGNTAGASKNIAIGNGAGSSGTYNLNNGTLRPSGGFAGAQFRQTIVGDNGATGSLNVGDGVGSADTAKLETNEDLFIGRSGGNGSMQVKSDGRVELRTNGANEAQLQVGTAGGVGAVTQTGGTVVSDGPTVVGDGSGGAGTYHMSGGSLATATDGSGALQLGAAGGTGTLRVQGAASATHGADLYVGGSSGSTGRLELIGSAATVQIGQLANATGADETFTWQVDAGGVTPLVVTGAGPLGANRVQLQSTTEVAANTGSGSTLAGDGAALNINNLQALSGSATLTLINNQTPDAVTGYFENPNLPSDLYEEGAAILGTGYAGAARISYAGGTGNDVVLNLTDFNADPRMIVRLKADDVAGVDGDAVSSWADAKTGDSFAGTVSQATASARPVKRAGVLNGHAAVDFDGVNDLLLSSQNNSLPTVGNGITVFMVATSDQGGDFGERAAQIGRSDGASGRVVGMDLSSSDASTPEGGAGYRWNNGRSMYDVDIDDADFHIVVFQVDHNVAYANAKMFIDGTMASNIVTGNSSNATGKPLLDGSTLELLLGTGRLNGGGLAPNDYYDGQIAEFLVYNEQMTVDDINVVADYLSFKYDLPFAYSFNEAGVGGSIPEPSTALLTVAGGVICCMRRRQK